MAGVSQPGAGSSSALPVDPAYGKTFGDVVPTRSHAGSKIEAQVRDYLVAAGHAISARRVGVLCHHTDPKFQFLTITPDVVLAELRLVIEVDPCGPASARFGPSHRGEEDKDRLRNELLEAVGWTVVRLRLGADEGCHIGDRDVVVESSGFTKAAQDALVAAIEDFRQQRPPRVRFVPKGKTPAPAVRRSHVVNIGPDRYTDDAFWFTWYPTLDSPERHKMRLAVAGRYLYRMVESESESLFVAEVGLHTAARGDWKALLTEYLAGKASDDLPGTTRWPWGDSLLQADDPADALAAEIAVASDRFTIDVYGFYFTVSGERIASWTADALARGEAQVVHIPPAGVEAGYRIVDVVTKAGFRGAYQCVVVSRAPGAKPGGAQ